jgi:magnesium chelatase family protein
MLIAAMNPCPCGYFTDHKRECRCTQKQIQNYRNRISGPLLDRIDIHVEVPAIHYRELSSMAAGEASAIIRERVVKGRRIQDQRFRQRNIHCNAAMTARDVQRLCPLSDDAHQQLKMAITELNFSARAYNRIIKVARTIADLAESEIIEGVHVCEAIQYRSLDRQLWV